MQAILPPHALAKLKLALAAALHALCIVHLATIWQLFM
jgi:hypothetical protein